MNVIVKKHYPVERLPADLREGLALGGQVEVQIRAEETDAAASHFSRFFHLQRSHFPTAEAARTHIRALRDEWN
jgi:hypothetical protein